MDFAEEGLRCQQPGNGEECGEDYPHQNLRQSNRAHAQNFAGKQFLGGYGGEQHLQNACALFFDDGPHYRHAVDQHDCVQQHHHGEGGEKDGGAAGAPVALLDADRFQLDRLEQRIDVVATHTTLLQMLLGDGCLHGAT